MDGIIIINKEKGFTSHDVVAKLRGILKQKKIGHTGTLDPDATGVLPVCLGKATKTVDLLTDKDKTYHTILQLGIETDTQDTTGTILAEKEVTVTEEEVRSVIQGFLGEQDQIPPMYSALKVNGQKLCDLARKGIEVERKPRRVSFYEITVEDVRLPFVEMTVSCSKGTYIRTLCHDIGQKLGCGASMKELKRTATAGFRLENAYTLKEVEQLRDAGELENVIVPVEKLFEDYGKLICRPEGMKLLQNGNPLSKGMVSGEFQKDPVRMYDADRHFIGIYQWRNEKSMYFPVKLF